MQCYGIGELHLPALPARRISVCDHTNIIVIKPCVVAASYSDHRVPPLSILDAAEDDRQQSRREGERRKLKMQVLLRFARWRYRFLFDRTASKNGAS